MADGLDAAGNARAQLLLQLPPQLATQAMANRFAIGGGQPKLTPLFQSRHPSGAALAGGASEWYVADLGTTGLGHAELWEAAHRAQQTVGLAAAGNAKPFVEPDLVQSWPYVNPVQPVPGMASAAPGAMCAFNDQNDELPKGPGFGWHLSAQYSELAAANQAVSGNFAVRIGILDTGIDLTHSVIPAHLNLELARNFIDDQAPDDVHDPFNRALFNNPGHGTGTIGLLAGQLYATQNGGGFSAPIGGAPWADIVPIRIASSVILFRTSTFAQGLDYLLAPKGDPLQRAHVVSMSMGGLASRAWADVVNRAYDAGIVMVTAAGNNYPLTPSMIVFPALFRRVIAACGVMADGRPYTRDYVPFTAMAGNYGPPAKMDTAVSAYTPNTPWAEVHCKAIVDMDGAGTSSATPQVAAAAALYLRQNGQAIAGRAAWEQVEIVRSALFGSAKSPQDDKYKAALGRGVLQANAALKMPIPQAVTKAPVDSADFALLRGLFGLGVAAPTPGPNDMLELELAQVVQREAALAQHYIELGLRGGVLEDESKRHLVDVVVSRSDASTLLKNTLKGAYPTQYVAVRADPDAPIAVPWEPREHDAQWPERRRLRAYAFDPQISSEFITAGVAVTTCEVRWELGLAPGPVGEYLEVVDYDPATGGFYQPVDLEDPRIIATEGLSPSEGNPQFHQQMVYAVAMRTIETFERALGRRVLWSPRMKGFDDSEYVPKLRIYPHAMREQNAYYDPTRKALLFGYFPAGSSQPGLVYPGGMVFTCLSHDIIAHETTHAILDGMQRGFMVPSNWDVLAFHEAFSDLVALLQHFSLPGVLEHQLSKTRGDLRGRTLLGVLAVQFGEATGTHGALRSAIGKQNEKTKQWEVLEPDPTQLDRATMPHDRGAILVAALFDAFLTIYDQRTADLLRIATGGSGVLPTGDVHPDLTRRLAAEAAKVARQLMGICVRAIDYCPPVDITFGDFLRAIVTADMDLMPQDPLHYRIAIVDAFRRRGIYPRGLRSVAADTLLWDEPEPEVIDVLREFASGLSPILDDLAHINPEGTDARQKLFVCLRDWRAKAHEALRKIFDRITGNMRAMLSRAMGLSFEPGFAGFEVRNIQVCQRVSSLGRFEPQLILSIVQHRRVDQPGFLNESFMFQGGCTLIVNPRTRMTQYIVRKNINSATRREDEASFRLTGGESDLNTYFGHAGDDARALAMVHAAGRES